IGSVTVSCNRGLRVLHRHCEPRFIAKVLGYTKSELPRPAETHVVLMVDGERRRLAAVVYALFSFGDQAPHLPGRKTPAVVQGRLTESLALPHSVAIALVVVGGDT